MKVALVALNARFTHSNLAIKYLAESVADLVDCHLLDFTINESKEAILHHLIGQGYSHIGFSVYIWNVEMVVEIIRDLKKIREDLVIFVGGPEVSFASEDFLKRTGADYLMVGEGEGTFRGLIQAFLSGQDPALPSLMSYKDGKVSGDGAFALAQEIPVIYHDGEYIEENRYVYYEASRGCPYNCAFCLSAANQGVRFKDLDLVKVELESFLEAGVGTVKFIDRSFNFNPHAKEIVSFLKDRDNGVTTFHLELHPSLIDQDFIDLLKASRPDLFQFEIGLQTTNPKTAKEIQRAGAFDDIKDVCQELAGTGHHVHMDLIAGLPYEDLESFKKSFNDLHSLGIEKIQLGFLKLLRGSRLRRDENKYGYKYFDKAPYEVISNKWITYEELVYIKGVEDMVERYHNEGYFAKSLAFIMENYYNEPWDFYSDMAEYWRHEGILYTSVSRIDLYNQLLNFIDESWDLDYLKELVIFDYYKAGNNRSSKFALVDYHKKYNNKKALDLIEARSNLLISLGYDPKTILKRSTIEIFNLDENFAYSEEEYYHIFIKEEKARTTNLVLGR